MKTKQQFDKIGQEIFVGDVVCVPAGKMFLEVGTIVKLTPKGAKVLVKSEWTDVQGVLHKFEDEKQKPIGAIVKINPEDALFMKLRGDI